MANAPDRRDIIVIRRVRDRIDRDYAHPLNVPDLARGAFVSAGHLSREFQRIYGDLIRVNQL
jgi:AraC-like DNA-binding protein